MSEWTQLSCGTWPTRALHLQPQGNYFISAGTPGLSATYHIYDDPGYFGNSRPTAIGVMLDGRVWGSSLSRLEATWKGSLTLYLWSDESRSDGVWAKVSEDLIDPVWLCAKVSEFPGFPSPYSASAEAFLTPMPSNFLYNPYYYNASIFARRTLSFGRAGQPAIKTIDLSQVHDSSLQLELAVTQFPNEQHATAIVGDFSKPAWHYVFDAQMSFIPDGFVSPFTLASIITESAQTPVLLYHDDSYAQFQQAVHVFGPTVRNGNLFRYSAGQFEEYHHDGHYPESGQPRFFRSSGFAVNNNFVEAPLAKPRNGAVPGATQNKAFEATSYNLQRQQYSVGNFSVPKHEAAGHWTALPASAAKSNGNLSITLELDSSAPPVAGSQIGPDQISQYPALAAMVDKTIEFARIGPSGLPLTHNSAYSQQINIPEEVSSAKRYGRAIDSSQVFDQKWKSVSEFQFRSTATPYVPPFVENFYPFFSGYISTIAEDFVDAYNQAISSRSVTFTPPSNTFPYINTVSLAASWEYHYVQKLYQCFATFTRAAGAVDGFPQAGDLPAAGVSASGNLDAWQKGFPAGVKLGSSDLFFRALLWSTARIESRNIQVYAYPATAVSGSRVVIGGEPFHAWSEQDAFVGMNQESLQLGTTFNEQQALALAAGDDVEVPGYVTRRIENAWLQFFKGSSAAQSLQEMFLEGIGPAPHLQTCIGYKVRLQ